MVLSLTEPPDVCFGLQFKLLRFQGDTVMSIARVTEISSTSTKSFEDAIEGGIKRATATLRNVRSAWVKEQQIKIEGESIVEYQVNMMITFVLDEDDKADIA
jgi:dodecin